MNKLTSLSLMAAVLLFAVQGGKANAGTHVYEVVEETFNANKAHANAYVDVDLWVTLTGPGGTYKVPAFWEEAPFRVRS